MSLVTVALIVDWSLSKFRLSSRYPWQPREQKSSCIHTPVGNVTLKGTQWNILKWPQTYQCPKVWEGRKGWELESTKFTKFRKPRKICKCNSEAMSDATISSDNTDNTANHENVRKAAGCIGWSLTSPKLHLATFINQSIFALLTI